MRKGIARMLMERGLGLLFAGEKGAGLCEGGIDWLEYRDGFEKVNVEVHAVTYKMWSDGIMYLWQQNFLQAINMDSPSPRSQRTKWDRIVHGQQEKLCFSKVLRVAV